MKTLLKILAIAVLLSGICAVALGEEVSRELIKGLDEQVQEIKTALFPTSEEV